MSSSPERKAPAMSDPRRVFDRMLIDLATRYAALAVIDARSDVDSPSSARDAAVLKDRFFSLAPAADHAVSMGVGMAAVGKQVVIVADRSALVARFWEDIRSVAAPTRQNVTLVAFPAAGGGPAAVEDVSMLRVIPSAEIYLPADLTEAGQVLSYSVTRFAPIYIRFPGQTDTTSIDPVFPENARFSPGVWPLLRSGDDLVMIASGDRTRTVLAAADRLASEGFQATVYHAGSLKPFDRSALLSAVRRSRKVLTC